MKENVAEHLNILPLLWKKEWEYQLEKYKFQLCPCEYKIQLLFWVPELTCFLLWLAEISFKTRRMSQRDWNKRKYKRFQAWEGFKTTNAGSDMYKKKFLY